MQFASRIGLRREKVRCDTNGDGIPETRQFAGTHRYNTAVKLANRFAADEGSVSTVIIASGESEVDAVAAAGLAGNLNAAVLLTRSNMLPHNVARFIDEHSVSEVIVVGGAAAVPDAIVTAIEGLGSRPSVERVPGADRYATAAAIGNRLGGPNPTWCGSDQSAAILVNGGEAGRADAVVAGPMAFRLGLPVLLTMADEVPEATASFLTDNKVERVVIVGGESAVSEDIVNTLVEDIGVVNTPRIAGPTAAATSVAVAKEMRGSCAEVLSTNKDMFALVNRDAIADGIAAAPVLGRGLGGGGPVPILLVGDELPSEVNDYLSGTDRVRAGKKLHLSVLAIGGTAVVSDEVMDAAKAAAKTSSPLTATITPITYTPLTLATAISADTDNNPATVNPCPAAVTAKKSPGDYTCQFRVTFSDDVKLATDADGSGTISDTERVGTVEDPKMYRLNGRRIAASAAATASQEPVTLLDLVFTADRTVTLTLSHHLDAGDTISVDNSVNEASRNTAINRIGANGDLRKLEPAELKLKTADVQPDRASPVVEVIAYPDTATFDVIVHEPNLNDGANELLRNTADVVSVNGKPIPALVAYDTATPPVRAPGSDLARTPRQVTVTTAALQAQSGRVPGTATTRYRITTSTVIDPTAPTLTLNSSGGGGYASVANELRAGDVITVNANAVRDDDGRGNALVVYTVPQVKTNTPGPTGTGDLEITEVSIGDYQHGVPYIGQTDPNSPEDGTTQYGNGVSSGQAHVVILTDALKLRAKHDGIASGARGNAWRIFGYDDRAAATRDTLQFEIDVAVDTDNQRISYTISDKVAAKPHRRAQIGDLAKALAGNDDFAANFTVSYVDPATDAKTDLLEATSPAGVQFFGGWSRVGVVVKFNNPIASLARTGGGQTCPDLVADINENSTGNYRCAVNHVAPDNQVHIRYISHSMAALPKRAGFRVIAASVATGYPDLTPQRGYDDDNNTAGVQAVTNVRKILPSLRPDSSIRP